MTKRLTSLLIIWLTLFSVAVPAIACAGATAHRDCCPDSGKPPCGECPEKAPGPGGSLDHCLAAPLSSVASSSMVGEQARKLVSPDLEPLLIASSALDAGQPDFTPEPIRHRWRQPAGNFEVPTYLITGRLRL